LSNSALEFNISASYGHTRVLHNVAACIAPGEILALVGLSGSGKSTLALSLLRLLHYRGGEASGSIRLSGRDLTSLSQREMRGVRGKLISYVPQNASSALNHRLRVRTLFEETWKAHSAGRADRIMFESALQSVQLPATNEFLNRRAGELSTGQGQRLLIALAILHKPTVLLADEPTSALDAITQSAVLELFRDLNSTTGTSMLFISHDLLSVASISHRVAILHEGRIVESGPPAQIFRDPRHPFTQQLVRAIPARDW
jgi:ABC-type dipeptide/oligopeptide/nickel transport system ATPase component